MRVISRQSVRVYALLALVLSLLTPFVLPKAAAQSSSAAAVHIVGWGETLYSIARLHGVSPDTIIAANDLSTPDHLFAGQALVIPGAAPAPAPQTSGGGTYVIQAGDGLYRIAVDHGVAVDALMAANGLNNPDQIYAGQVLVIPGTDFAPVQNAQTSATGGPGSVHVVQPGETLFRISQQHGVTVDELVAANGLLSASQIYAGQQLIVPGPGAEPAALPQLSGTHIVQPGESLGAIAERYGVSVATLAQANNLSDPSLIYAGQRLVVPGAGTNGPVAPEASADTPGVHIVQAGDTLFRISARYGVSLYDLMAVNGLTDGSMIYAGQQLTIPGGAGAPAPEAAPAPAADPAPPTITSGKQIVVQLSTQRTFAYEDGQLVREFIVSTGLPATPTVTGDYAIYVKYTAQRMVGPGYDLPNVPWGMYFYQGYALHGTYWHNNFGQPMSRGCVNMRIDDAEWL